MFEQCGTLSCLQLPTNVDAGKEFSRLISVSGHFAKLPSPDKLVTMNLGTCRCSNKSLLVYL